MGSRNVKSRPLHWKISYSRRVNSLSGPWPMLLYTWLLPCQDNKGRMEGDADILKGMIFPRQHKITMAMVERWMLELHNAGLVFRYQVNGSGYLQFPTDAVEEYQKLLGHMKDESDFPGPPEDAYATWLKDVRTSIYQYEPVYTSTNECVQKGSSRVVEGKGSSRVGEGFARFWSAYPRKEGKSDALRAWERLEPDAALVSQILTALEAHRLSPQWQDDGGRYIPHPSTWLNGKRWEDQLEPLRDGKPDAVRAFEAKVRADAANASG